MTVRLLGKQPYRLSLPAFRVRFFEKVHEEPNSGCWLWSGALRNGYGVIGVGGRINGTSPVEYAHRLVYWDAHGEIPAGHEVRHKCDNRPCCNPAHLESGTRRQNVQDAIRRGRAWKTPRYRPTREQVAVARRMAGASIHAVQVALDTTRTQAIRAIEAANA